MGLASLFLEANRDMVDAALIKRLEEAIRLAWGNLAEGRPSSFEQRMALREIQRLNADLLRQYRARDLFEIQPPAAPTRVKRPRLNLVGHIGPMDRFPRLRHAGEHGAPMHEPGRLHYAPARHFAVMGVV